LGAPAAGAGPGQYCSPAPARTLPGGPPCILRSWKCSVTPSDGCDDPWSLGRAGDAIDTKGMEVCVGCSVWDQARFGSQPQQHWLALRGVPQNRNLPARNSTPLHLMFNNPTSVCSRYIISPDSYQLSPLTTADLLHRIPVSSEEATYFMLLHSLDPTPHAFPRHNLGCSLGPRVQVSPSSTLMWRCASERRQKEPPSAPLKSKGVPRAPMK